MGVQLPAFLGGMQCDVYYCTYTYLDQEPESILVPSGQFQDEFGNPLPQENVVTGGAGQNEYGEAIKVCRAMNQFLFHQLVYQLVTQTLDVHGEP